MRLRNIYSSAFLFSARKIFRLAFSLTLTAAVFGIFGTQSAMAADFTVTTTGDSGAGSLRQAILDFNSSPPVPGVDRILFNIAGSGVKTITLNSELPAIVAGGLLIDGWSQGGQGYTGPPLIELRGDSSNMCYGLNLGVGPFGSGNTEVRGFIINGFQCGVEAAGIYIGSDNNVVKGCYIGTTSNGNSAFANKKGIIISGDNNLIGNGNVISGNVLFGIHILPEADNNRLEGNHVGVNPNGTVAVGNGNAGIAIYGLNNLVGGITPDKRNVISANNGSGVFISSANNRVEGNYIGLNAAGTGRLGNHEGVRVAGTGNTIGGPGPERRNIISGSLGSISEIGSNGVVIFGSNNNVQGNYIGLDVTGSVPIGNRRYGILIDGNGVASGGDNNLIGGSGPQWGNVVAGNGITGGGPGGGIKLLGYADNNIINFNNISYNAGSDNEGNEGCGIWVGSGSNNLIGGTVTLGDITFSAGNTISWNYRRGVRISNGLGNGNTGNKVSRNSIFFNGVDQGNPVGIMGIDLGTVGITANDNCDADTGANNLQNFPVLVSAISADNTTTILGSLNSVAGRTYTVEFFSNTSCSGQGYGQGQTYLGQTTVTTIGQSCSVNFQAAFNMPTLPAGTVITATATDSDGNTSEFSACRTVSSSSLQFSTPSYTVAENGGSATITVTRTGDTSGTASVNYATSNGTATATQDYAAASGTLNFAANETSKTFSVPILDDNFYEGDETVNITLSNVTGSGNTLGSPNTAVLTITDNESQPTISITDVSQNEGNSGTSNFTFTVNLTVASAQTVSVTYVTADGTATTANNDYQATGATLTFTPNQTSKTLNVVVNGDTVPEPNETFFVNLTNPSNATISDNQGQGTIVNDDPCNNSINPMSVNSSSGGGNGIVNVTSPCSWTAVSNAAWITVTSGSNGSGNGTVNYSVAANSGVQRSGTITIAGQTFTVNQASAILVRKPADFDGDNKTDLSIFRPSLGQWWYQQSSNNTTFAFTFGISTDKITPGDYDSDGKTDIAFWRPSTAEWFVLRSSNLTFYSAPFGVSTDVPAPGDFDGDGKFDLAVFRPSTATWYILKSSDGAVQTTPFGVSGDIPQPADYDGDGKADACIFRPTGGSGNAEWWMLRSSNSTVFATPFGSASDKPVPGDYTGDGKADCAFFRPSSNEWFILRSEDLTFYAAPFGTNGDIAVPGDYDGDNKFDLAVFRPSNVTWFVLKTTGGTLIQQFGSTGDTPVPSAYVP